MDIKMCIFRISLSRSYTVIQTERQRDRESRLDSSAAGHSSGQLRSTFLAPLHFPALFLSVSRTHTSNSEAALAFETTRMHTHTVTRTNAIHARTHNKAVSVSVCVCVCLCVCVIIRHTHTLYQSGKLSDVEG